MASIKPRHAFVEYDGGVIEGEFLFGGVTNSTSVAGFVKLDPKDVSLWDGLFEVILIKKPESMGELSAIVNNIMKKDYSSDSVIFLHTGRIKFTFDEDVEWTRDGENGGIHREIEIINCHEALEIIL